MTRTVRLMPLTLEFITLGLLTFDFHRYEGHNPINRTDLLAAFGPIPEISNVE